MIETSTAVDAARDLRTRNETPGTVIRFDMGPHGDGWVRGEDHDEWFGCTCRPTRCGRRFKTKRERNQHVARIYCERIHD